MELNGTIFIAKPAGEVYSYVMDVSNDKNWREGVDESGFRSGDSFSPGSIGYTRAGDVVVEWKIISFKPGESVDWELLTGPFKGYGGYRFQPIGNGTQFTLVADVRPTGIYRLVSPLFARIGRSRNQADVERLREILEADDQYSL
jgi:uncharacterized membrane protein